MDAARPMETTDRFPQVFGKPQKARFPTAPTAIIVYVSGKNEDRNPDPLSRRLRTHYTAGRPSVASLRSRCPVRLITMKGDRSMP